MQMRRLLPVLVVLMGALPAACGGGHPAAHPAASTQHAYHTSSGAPRAHAPGFGLPPAGSPRVPARATVTGTYLMLDAVDVNDLNGLTPFVVAGYTSGYWPTYFDMVARHYPHVISIAVNTGHHAQCLDIEPGDASPDQAGGWVQADKAAGFGKPCLYASLSDWNAIDANLRAWGIDPHSIFRWVAYWTFRDELIQGFDAQQWTDRYLGRNVDASRVTPEFAGINPNPGPQPADFLRWRKARDASLTAYHKNLCVKPVLGRDLCGMFAWRVNHFQLLVDQEGKGPKCFGRTRHSGAPVCQIVRPAVAVRSRAATSSYRHHNKALGDYFSRKIDHSLSTSRL